MTLEKPLERGDTLADYVVVRLIGEGGMAYVYEAEHSFTGRRVALKVLYRHRAEAADFRARAVQEARATAQLRHRNLVALENANLTADGRVWMAMEYLEGRTLRELLARSRRLPVADVLGYLVEICDGVAAAHEMHILHRDLKPENVFLTTQNSIRVLDFGAAKARHLGIVNSTEQMAERGGARRVIGTVEYMAPEQFRGEKATVATDLYAIGLIGYELLASGHPFGDPGGGFPDAFEMARRHLETAPEPLPRIAPHVPDHVWQVLRRALDKEIGRRQRSASELAVDLRVARDRHVRESPPERNAFEREWKAPGSWAAHGPAFEVPAGDEAPAAPSQRVRAEGASDPRPSQAPSAPSRPAVTTIPLTLPGPGAPHARHRLRRARIATAGITVFVLALLALGARLALWPATSPAPASSSPASTPTGAP